MLCAPLALMWRRSAKCGVERQIQGVAGGWSRLDIPSAPAISPCSTPPAAVGTCHPIEGGIETPRGEDFSHIHLLTALPPLSFGGPFWDGLLGGLLDRLAPVSLCLVFSGWPVYAFFLAAASTSSG